MLKADYTPLLTPLDELVFTQLVPADHYLRRLKAAVDFARLRPLLADCYSAERGRGALDPVCLLKLLLLQFHYGWSDESVVQQAQVNVALRFFLDWPLTAAPPDASLLPHFRKRLGAERLQRVFADLVQQARDLQAGHRLAEIEGVTLLSKSGGKSDFYKKAKCLDLKARIIVLSDSLSQGKGEDKSGKTIVEHLVSIGFEPENIELKIIADDPDELSVLVCEAIDQK